MSKLKKNNLLLESIVYNFYLSKNLIPYFTI